MSVCPAATTHKRVVQQPPRTAGRLGREDARPRGKEALDGVGLQHGLGIALPAATAVGAHCAADAHADALDGRARRKSCAVGAEVVHDEVVAGPVH
eukprot:2613600-Prymnesium_polylepis.1